MILLFFFSILSHLLLLFLLAKPARNTRRDVSSKPCLTQTQLAAESFMCIFSVEQLGDQQGLKDLEKDFYMPLNSLLVIAELLKVQAV